MKKAKTIFTNEYGAALPLVLALMLIVTLLSITAMNIAANNTTLASRFFGTEKALYAAEKGYNQYLWKLNNDGDFYLDTSKYTCDTTSEAGFYIYSPITDEGENYRVQIRIPVISGTPVSNQAFIRSTGWNSNDPEQQRTVEVELLRRSFTQYAFVSDSENTPGGQRVIWYQKDNVFGPLHTNGTLYLEDKLIDNKNATFWSEVTYGNRIELVDGDVFNWSPDAPVLNDPNIFKKGHMQMTKRLEFPGNAELNELKVLAKTNGDYYNGRTCIYLNGDSYDVRYYDRNTDRNTSSWYYNGQRYRINLYKNNVAPSSNDERKKTLSEWGDESSADRALYTTLNEDGSEKQNYYSFEALKAACPDSISLPDNGIIFVDGLTGDGSHPFNSILAAKYQPTMGNVFVSGKLADRLTIVSANDIYITGHDPTDWRHPRKISGFNGSSPPGITYSSPVPYYQPQFADDQFTETTVYGTNEMLGLIARRNIHVLRWNWPSQISHNIDALVLPAGDRFSYNWGEGLPSSSDLGSPGISIALKPLDYYNLMLIDNAPTNISIYGALFAITGSFGLETNIPGLGNLKQTLQGAVSWIPTLKSKDRMTVFGSIGQNFREHSSKPPTFGDSGLTTGNWVDGYSTTLTQDPRMKIDMPPHFVSPIKSGWYSIHWEEINTHIPGD